MSFLSPSIKLVALFLALFGRGKYKQYGLNVWEGLDNSVSADVGGSPDESVSSRLGKARIKGSKNLSFIADRVDLVAFEFTGQTEHCKKSIERDRGRKSVMTY